MATGKALELFLQRTPMIRYDLIHLYLYVCSFTSGPSWGQLLCNRMVHILLQSVNWPVKRIQLYPRTQMATSLNPK